MIILDYCSFTFCPDQLAPYRRLASAGRQSFAQFLKNRDKSEPVIDVDFLNDCCREQLTTFVQVISKDFFAGQEYTTYDAWSELFTVRERGRGMFGYRWSWDMYLNGTHIGIAAAGAKNGGCYVSFSGEGTVLIDPEKLLKQIKYLPMIRLTRIDLAFDDYNGTFSCDYAEQLWMDGAFKASEGGRNPKAAWFMSGGELVVDDDGNKSVAYTEGRTFQVGSRENGKLCRIYEKGKQLGSPDSNWTRWEVEIHAKDREIPLDVLVDPATYFKGAYPALGFVEKVGVGDEPTRIQTRKNKVKVSYERMASSAKQSYGALINVMRVARQMSDEEIVAELIAKDEYAVPRRLEKAVGVSLPDSGPWKAPETNQGETACLN